MFLEAAVGRFTMSVRLVGRSLFPSSARATQEIGVGIPPCSHGAVRRPFHITVLGVPCELLRSPLCAACTAEYLNRYAIICPGCGEPILPGDRVAREQDDGGDDQLTHLLFGCCGMSSCYVGMWGEGVLISAKDVAQRSEHNLFFAGLRVAAH